MKAESIRKTVKLIETRNEQLHQDDFSFLMFPEIIMAVKSGSLKSLKNFTGETLKEYFNEALYDYSIQTTLPYVCGCLVMIAIEAGLSLSLSAAYVSYLLSYVNEVTDVDGYCDFILELSKALAQEVEEEKFFDIRNRRVKLCMKYINDHLSGNLSTENLAFQCGCSQSYLRKLFRAYTGKPITRYIQEEKIRRAKLLLKYTDLSYISICQQLNFCNQSYFISMFNKICGCTPGSYRRSLVNTKEA